VLPLYKFAKKYFKLLYLIFILKSPIYPGVGDLNFENPGGPRGGGFKVLKPPGAPGVGDLFFRTPH